MAKNMELTMGSSAFLVLLGTLSIMTNLMFNVICMAGWMLGMKILIVVNCSGFWLIVFSLMVLECMNNPNNPRSLMCIPVQFPSKYFPLILYMFFCILSGPQLDLACAVGVGYLYSQNYLDRLKVSQSYLVSVETVGILRVAASNLSYWVSNVSASGSSVPFQTTVDNSNSTQQQQQNSVGTYAFPAPGEASKPDLFPGAGQMMSSSTQVENTSTWLPQIVNSVHTSVPSREEMATRRLAALSNADV